MTVCGNIIEMRFESRHTHTRGIFLHGESDRNQAGKTLSDKNQAMARHRCCLHLFDAISRHHSSFCARLAL
jgi:hypothetical protein